MATPHLKLSSSSRHPPCKIRQRRRPLWRLGKPSMVLSGQLVSSRPLPPESISRTLRSQRTSPIRLRESRVTDSGPGEQMYSSSRRCSNSRAALLPLSAERVAFRPESPFPGFPSSPASPRLSARPSHHRSHASPSSFRTRTFGPYLVVTGNQLSLFHSLGFYSSLPFSLSPPGAYTTFHYTQLLTFAWVSSFTYSSHLGLLFYPYSHKSFIRLPRPILFALGPCLARSIHASLCKSVSTASSSKAEARTL